MIHEQRSKHISTPWEKTSELCDQPKPIQHSAMIVMRTRVPLHLWQKLQLSQIDWITTLQHLRHHIIIFIWSAPSDGPALVLLLKYNVTCTMLSWNRPASLNSLINRYSVRTWAFTYYFLAKIWWQQQKPGTKAIGSHKVQHQIALEYANINQEHRPCVP